MSQVDLVPISTSMNATSDNAYNQLTLAPKDSSGAGVDLTGWTGIGMNVAPSGQNLNSVFAQTFAPVILLASAGKFVSQWKFNINPGSYTFEVYGQGPSSGQTQTIATGSLTIK